jgi:hypothetical protein
MVIVETLPAGSVVEMQRFRDAVVGNIERSQQGFAVAREGALSTTLEMGHLVEGTSSMNGQALEWRIALYVQSPHIIQVVGFGDARSFADVEAEVRAMIDSLAL